MTTGCEEQQRKIARLLAGDLAEDERQSLEAHLSTCALCRSEKESYARIVAMLHSSTDEPAPRHFFIHNERQETGPWRLYRRMDPVWQWAAAAVAVLFLLIGAAAFSRLHFSSDAEGWTFGFGDEARIAALEAEISKAKNERSRYATTAQILEMQTGIENILAGISQEQQLLLTALELQDSKLADQITTAETRWRTETRELLTPLYQARVQDLENIGVRFDSLELNHEVKAQQTDAILAVLLHEADFGSHEMEN